MVDAPAAPQGKTKKDRSPSFPFISLEEALKRLVAFEQTFNRHPAPAGKAGLAWGMKDGSSQAFQTLAALKAFGLIQYSGSGKTLVATLTDDARTYLRAQQDQIKRDVIRDLATKPKQIEKFWKIWGRRRPPDPVCLDELILHHAFTDGAARNFLKVYDDTIAYAGFSDPDTAIGDDAAKVDLPLEFKVGDLVNWESGGQVQWRTPRKIISIDEKEGTSFYRVAGAGELAGQTGWIPVEQAVQHQASAAATDAVYFAPPPAETSARSSPKPSPEALQEGSRKAVFPVSDGDVTLIFPAMISDEGLGELGDYLEIFLKRERKKREGE